MSVVTGRLAVSYNIHWKEGQKNGTYRRASGGIRLDVVDRLARGSINSGVSLLLSSILTPTGRSALFRHSEALGGNFKVDEVDQLQ